MVLHLPVLFLSLVIDRSIGDPQSSLHPVALLGKGIEWWAKPSRYPKKFHRFIGVIGWFSTIILFSLPFIIIEVWAPWYLYIILAPFLLKICFAWRALEEHAGAVTNAHTSHERAKQASLLVSRDTSVLDDEHLLSAAYESVAENLNDSIIAPLFWFVLLGLPGAALYRAVNTMDAMLGYRDERERIGWCAARMDDIFSFIPARICGGVLVCIYILKRRIKPAWAILIRDRKKRPGFNGGIPMSLIAGGEGILFEKTGVYQIGNAERTLVDAGPAIIRTVQEATLIFCLIAGIALLLLDPITNIYGI